MKGTKSCEVVRMHGVCGGGKTRLKKIMSRGILTQEELRMKFKKEVQLAEELKAS